MWQDCQNPANTTLFFSFFIASLLLWKPGGAGDERLMMLRMAESGRPYSSKRHTHRKRMLRYGLSSSTRGVWLRYQHACRAVCVCVCVCVAGRQRAGAEGGVYQTSGAIIMTRSWTTIKLQQVSTSWPVAHLCVCVCVSIWTAGPSSDNTPYAQLSHSQFFSITLSFPIQSINPLYNIWIYWKFKRGMHFHSWKPGSMIQIVTLTNRVC